MPGPTPAEIPEPLPAFRSIEVWDLGQDVLLSVHASLPQRVTVAAPPDAVIRTAVRGDTLVISGESSAPVEISVALPDLKRLVLWGDTHARVRAIHSPDLAVTLADNASVEAQGVTAHLELVVDHLGHAQLRSLSTQEARVTASGRSRVDLQVASRLDATVGDQAGVYYTGDPEVHQTLHRSGQVRSLDH